MKNNKKSNLSVIILAIILALLCLGIAVMALVMTGHRVPGLDRILPKNAGSGESVSDPAPASSDAAISADPADTVSVSGSSLSAAVATPAPTISATPTPTPEPTPDPASYNTADTWALMLVNKDHPMPEGYVPQVTPVENDQSTDVRCADALTRMLADCRAAGYNPLVISGYRTHETQELYFNNTTQMYVDQGMDEASAEAEAATSVAVPGTSEHEIGLAVDIGTTDNTDIDSSQDSDPTQEWLHENCCKYGYILRYPPEKSDVTGIIYESWHYRYVGETAARVIYENNLCLEEYLQTYVEPFTSLEGIDQTAMAALGLG